MGGIWLGWDRHPDPTAVPFRVVQPDPQDRDRAWVGGSSGIFMTQDGGQSWFRTLRIDGGDVRALANDRDAIYAAGGKVYAADSGSTVVQLAVYLSTNGGRNWHPLATPDAAQGALEMVVARDGSLLVGTESGVWRLPRRP